MLRSTLLAVLMFGPAIGVVHSQEFSAISTIDRMIETPNEDGTVKVEFVKADRVTPGENLYYKLAYDNPTNDEITDVKLVMNVPPEVTYAENSASVEGRNIEVSFSTDGGKTFAPRGELLVSLEGQPRRAVSEDITSIRWTFLDPILPNTEGTVGFQAIVR